MNQTRRAFIKTFIYLLPGLSGLSCGGGGSSSRNSGSAPDSPSSSTSTPLLVAPSIISEPDDQSVPVGISAVFQVLAEGSEPLTYQWMRNGIPISGETASSYITPPIPTAGFEAQYAVRVSNNTGSVLSRAATLLVTGILPTADSTVVTIDSLGLTVDMS